MRPSRAAGRARRGGAAAALLTALVVGACGGAGDVADEGAGSTAPPPAGEAPAGGDAAAAPPAAPAAPGAGWTVEDSIQAMIQDSIQEARLMAARQASMDSYAGCMEKTKGADPPQRAILEAACRRARGAPAGGAAPP